MLATYNLTIGDEAYPGLDVQTDAQILDWIRGAVTPCKMGKSNDSMAVIDSQARVFGVRGLRVVDASTFPFLPPGHPQSTVYALVHEIANDVQVGQRG